MNRSHYLCALLLLFTLRLSALDRPGTTFKVFQFPADQIPRIDGNTDDWKVVPDELTPSAWINLSTRTDPNHKTDTSDFDVKIKVD